MTGERRNAAEAISTTGASRTPRRPRPDNDTAQRGLEPPFDYWESDHTGLVHVLWAAERQGLVLGEDDDEIARLILRSRWFAATKDVAQREGRDLANCTDNDAVERKDDITLEAATALPWPEAALAEVHDTPGRAPRDLVAPNYATKTSVIPVDTA